MRASIRCWLGALPLAALVVALPMVLIGPGARSLPASSMPHCGIAAWTGTCACASGPRAAPMSYDAFARSLRTAGDTAGLEQASRQCGLDAPSD